jgi:phenylacetate-CoA ligase
VHPDDCRDLADLAKFPTTSKADLRENYPFGMFAVPQEQVRRIHASSGTTGRPTVVGYTAGDIDVWATVMARSIRAAGGRPGHRVHNAYGYGLFTGGLGAHYGIEKLGAVAIPVSGGMTPRQVQLITDFRPDVIMLTPSYMLTVIDEFVRQGLDPAASSLQVGIFGAEPWTEQMRHEIEDRMDMHAVDIYGLSEVMGPGVAQECVETKDGLHVWEDHFYPEVIDPLTEEVLPEGEQGELVFTSLTEEAMPVTLSARRGAVDPDRSAAAGRAACGRRRRRRAGSAAPRRARSPARAAAARSRRARSRPPSRRRCARSPAGGS